MNSWGQYNNIDDLINMYLGPNWQQGMQRMGWAGNVKGKIPEESTWGQAGRIGGSIIGSIIGSYYGGPVGGQIGGKAGGKIGGSWGTFADTGDWEALFAAF